MTTRYCSIHSIRVQLQPNNNSRTGLLHIQQCTTYIYSHKLHYTYRWQTNDKNYLKQTNACLQPYQNNNKNDNNIHRIMPYVHVTRTPSCGLTKLFANRTVLCIKLKTFSPKSIASSYLNKQIRKCTNTPAHANTRVCWQRHGAIRIYAIN